MSEVSVCLKPGSRLEHFTDQSTYLVVTHAPQVVDEARVGAATRACLDVVVQPVAPVPAPVAEPAPVAVPPSAPTKKEKS